MASRKRSRGRRFQAKGTTRAKALGQEPAQRVYKDLKKDPRGWSVMKEEATRMLRSAGPGPGVLVGHTEEHGFLVLRAPRGHSRLLSRGAM